MRKEILELLNDYGNSQLHEHLFEGEDDIWLTKLDELFDSMALDQVFLCKDVSSHFFVMSIIGGLLATPLYIILNFEASPDTNLKSFMGILELSSQSFYQDMFSGSWKNIVIMLALSILYTLKPLTTTPFVLS
jgi:hypothetical protein